MLTGDLVGAPVDNPDGTRPGVVIDIRTRPERNADGHMVLVLHGLVVGTHRWRLFGYERRVQHGPIVIRAVMRLAHRNTRYVRWDEVDMRGEDGIRLLRSWDELPMLHELAE